MPAQYPTSNHHNHHHRSSADEQQVGNICLEAFLSSAIPSCSLKCLISATYLCLSQRLGTSLSAIYLLMLLSKSPLHNMLQSTQDTFSSEKLLPL